MHSAEHLHQYGLLLKAARYEAEAALEKEANIFGALRRRGAGTGSIARAVRMDDASVSARLAGREARSVQRGASRAQRDAANIYGDNTKLDAANQAKIEAAAQAARAQQALSHARTGALGPPPATVAAPTVTAPAAAATAPAAAAPAAPAAAPGTGMGWGTKGLLAGGVGATGYVGHRMGHNKGLDEGEEAGNKKRNLAFGAGVATGALGGPMIRQVGQSMHGPPPHMMY